ncbi:MAG: hypothetical protein HY762_03535, partial [Planctomycetes bacterium]|nr:hypothetical protein [Planctomycetota bacterium]
VYESGKLEEKLEYGQKKYGRQWLRFIGPLKGYKAGHILGLAQMAVMALAGDRKLVDYLKARNVRPEGEPTVITTLERVNQFKRILGNLIVHWGSEIIDIGYEKCTIKQASEELNQLVNDYRREGIIPFSPGGKSADSPALMRGDSHIDFEVVEIPDPVKPLSAVSAQAGGQKAKCLGLDIQISLEASRGEFKGPNGFGSVETPTLMAGKES